MLVGLIGLRMAYDISPLLFHSVVEIFSVTVSGAVFMLAWNADRFVSRSFLPVLGAAYLFTGSLDLLHTLAYAGMNVLPSGGVNQAAQFWIAARFVEAVGLAASAALPRQRSRYTPVVALGGLAMALALLVFEGTFPDCFVPGVGLTPFKIMTEYAICGVLALAAGLLWRNRAQLARDVVHLLIASIAVTVASELCFTLYTNPFGLSNDLGHALKAISFYLVYRAVFEFGLRDPYGLLLKEVEEQRKALEAANRELEAYARNVSHDLRSPLSAIAHGGAVIEHWLSQQPGEETPSAVVKASSAIQRGAASARSLIEDSLALARLGQDPVDWEPVNVGDVLKRLEAELEQELDRSGMHLTMDGSLGTIEASPVHIYQLFANMIRNSIIHGQRRGGRIRVSYQRNEALGRHEYTICDDGPGIPPEMLDKLFQPFVRGKQGGTGIGLAIVGKIVGVYGGTIRAANRGGACFELTLRDAGSLSRFPASAASAGDSRSRKQA